MKRQTRDLEEAPCISRFSSLYFITLKMIQTFRKFESCRPIFYLALNISADVLLIEVAFITLKV